MNELSSGSDWNSLLLFAAYGVLIFLYLIILKVLMNCIEQLTSKSTPATRSVIDVDIHREAANRHVDDKSHTFDAFGFAMTFLKLIISLGGIVAIFVLITIKLNVFFAFGISVLVGVIVWQFMEWRKGKGKEVIKHYEGIFIQIGGYNIGTLIFFVIALILVTVGLVLLP